MGKPTSDPTVKPSATRTTVQCTYLSVAADLFDRCLTGLAYIICLNSKIFCSSSSELKLQKLFSSVNGGKKEKSNVCFDFLIAHGIFSLCREQPWQNPGDLRASLAAVPILQLVSQVQTQRVSSERFTFITIQSAKSLCKRASFSLFSCRQASPRGWDQRVQFLGDPTHPGCVL